MGEELDPAQPGASEPGASTPGPGGADRAWPRQAAAQPRRSRSSSFWHGVREVAIVVVTALVISVVVRTFLVQAFWVPSGSMEQTLVRGDRILVWKPGGDPGHGEVVVFKDPADWLADPVPTTGLGAVLGRAAEFVGVLPSTTGDDLVKRVIGVGGDTVECCSPDGRIMRNGQPLDEPYLYPGQPTNQVVFKVEVPEGRLFVMGDHRADSADSRFHLDVDDGTVPVENVVGTAKVIVWPPSRWATLPTYVEQQSAQGGAGVGPGRDGGPGSGAGRIGDRR